MKAVSLLLVLALCIASGPCTAQVFKACPYEVSIQCPTYDGDFPTFFAHPDDCSKGCECSKGTAFEVQCQPGLLWDDTVDVCNWANQVNCGSRPLPP
ncbi:peritrophin-1-like [Penaeus japonicus]|uniref:peritrophin-1-like n=1 Tax=Penaeus japonicus TaxID=27405 RepID=UPI001C712B5A|nr:peritrophin-1-like [Penaeus japonicus]